MGDWKGIRLAKDAALELYNLSTDPYEQQNVAAANPGVVARIEAHFRTARTDSVLWPGK
jgi:arylsulfatase A